MTTQKVNICLKLLTSDDISKVQTFLKKFFYKDEPLNVCVKIWENENAIKSLEVYSTSPIKYNCSFMATTESGNIVGVCLNKIRKPIEEDKLTFEDPIFSKIVGIFAHVDKRCNIFFMYDDIDSYLQHDIVSVDSTARGQGIATKMIEASRDLAKNSGLKLTRMDCTSSYSAKIAEALGFTKICSLKYEDYKINGEQVFNPDPPHTEFAVYIKKIDG